MVPEDLSAHVFSHSALMADGRNRSRYLELPTHLASIRVKTDPSPARVIHLDRQSSPPAFGAEP
jgi:hypothetical protein